MAKSYSKQVTFFKGEGFTVGIAARYEESVVVHYSVKFAGSVRANRKTHTVEFKDLDEAKLYFEDLKLNGVASLKPGAETALDRTEEARKIIEAPHVPRTSMQKTLALLASIDKCLTKSLHPQHERHRNLMISILMPYSTLPNSNEAESWLLNCVNALSTFKHSKKEVPVARSTIKKRFHFFKRAVEKIVSYPAVFGKELANEIAACLQRIKPQMELKKQAATPVKSYSPLGLTEIIDLLESSQTLQEKMFVLKSLACGLRPSEVIRLDKKHLINGKLSLKDVDTKTGSDKRPLASLVLKVILRLQPVIGLPSRRWMEKNITVAPYRFRSTLATHLIYCGVDFNTVAECLNHTTAEMSLKHYAKRRPPGALDNVDEYYGTGNIIVDGYTVAQNESKYQQFLLDLTIRTLFSFEKSDLQRSNVKQIILEESGVLQPKLKKISDSVY